MVRRHQPLRLTATIFVVLSMLLSQLALASYVCPAQDTAATMAEMMTSGLPCEGMDQEQPALCAEHSSAAPQSADTIKAPVLPMPMVAQIIELPFMLDAVARAVPWAATPEAQPPPSPLFLSTLRLRV